MTVRYRCDGCGTEADTVDDLLGWVELRALGPAERPFYRQRTSHLCRLCYARVQEALHPPQLARGGTELQVSEHSQTRDTEQ